ncbi:MAG: ABC transporter ATP-binding protein [Planctomycetota bacterium]
MTSVQLQKIDQSSGRLKVLRELDLNVESGQYLVLLGASGGGKTTILRIIAGLQAPDSGSVQLGDEDVTRIAPRSRNVAMVFQHDALYPHLTVDGSIRLALKKIFSRTEVDRRVSETARLTGIESFLDRYPHHLSGGQLRRAAIAKALARESGLRLLDEPLSSLDGEARESLQDDILQWHRALGGTTIHVTHDGQEAMRMADKIAVLQDGRIVQVGDPVEIYRQPQTLAVARAIGSPTIQCFEVDTSPDSGPCVLKDVGVALNAEPPTHDKVEWVVAVRPESLKVVDTESDDAHQDAIRIPGVLQRRANLGRDVMLTIRCGEKRVTAIARSAAADLEIGDPVYVCAETAHLHWFEANP